MNPQASSDFGLLVSALIALAGVLASVLVAGLVARYTAKTELKKLTMTWEREDVVSSDAEFAEMAGLVEKFRANPSIDQKHELLGKIAGLRVKEVGSLGATLDRLYTTVDVARAQDLWSAQNALDEVIAQKREAKGNEYTHQD